MFCNDLPRKADIGVILKTSFFEGTADLRNALALPTKDDVEAKADIVDV